MLKKEELKNLYKENMLICNCAVLAVLFFVNCFWGPFAYISFGILGIMILVSSIKDGFSLLVSAIPFFCIDMSVSVIMFLICLILYVIKAYIIALVKDKKKISKVSIILFIVLVIYSLLPIGDYTTNLFIKVACVVSLMLVINLFTMYPEALRLRFNVNILAMSLLLSVIYCVTYFISPYMQERLVVMRMSEDFIRFAAMFDNPLNLAMICEICLSMLVYFIVTKATSWVDFISFIIFSILGILTISKTFIMLYSIMLFALLIYSFKISPKKTAIWVGVISVVGTLVFIIGREFVATYLERFIGSDFLELDFRGKMDYLTTGRSELWLDTLQYLIENPIKLIFGAGLGSGRITIHSTHNFYISLLFSYGIVGAILFVVVFSMLIKKLVKAGGAKISKAIIVPMIIMILLMCVEDFFLFIY